MIVNETILGILVGFVVGAAIVTVVILAASYVESYRHDDPLMHLFDDDDWDGK